MERRDFSPEEKDVRGQHLLALVHSLEYRSLVQIGLTRQLGLMADIYKRTPDRELLRDIGRFGTLHENLETDFNGRVVRDLQLSASEARVNLAKSEDVVKGTSYPLRARLRDEEDNPKSVIELAITSRLRPQRSATQRRDLSIGATPNIEAVLKTGGCTIQLSGQEISYNSLVGGVRFTPQYAVLLAIDSEGGAYLSPYKFLAGLLPMAISGYVYPERHHIKARKVLEMVRGVLE